RVTASALVEAAKEGLEYRPQPDGKTWVLVKRERKLFLHVNPGAEGSPELAELAGLLNLVPGLPRYDLTVVSGGVPDPLLRPSPPSTEIRLVPRSTFQAYFYLANGVEVPPEHLACGLAAEAPDGSQITRGLLEVHVAGGHKPPPGAFVAVKHRGWWYFIDDADQASKATLVLMLALERLDFARQRVGAPVLTLPVGR